MKVKRVRSKSKKKTPSVNGGLAPVNEGLAAVIETVAPEPSAEKPSAPKIQKTEQHVMTEKRKSALAKARSARKSNSDNVKLEQRQDRELLKTMSASVKELKTMFSETRTMINELKNPSTNPPEPLPPAPSHFGVDAGPSRMPLPPSVDMSTIRPKGKSFPTFKNKSKVSF